MRLDERDLKLLWDMWRAAESAVEFTRGEAYEKFVRDKMLHLATERVVQIIGEAARRVSNSVRSQLPNVARARSWRPGTFLSTIMTRSMTRSSGVSPRCMPRSYFGKSPPCLTSIRPVRNQQSRSTSHEHITLRHLHQPLGDAERVGGDAALVVGAAHVQHVGAESGGGGSGIELGRSASSYDPS